MKRLLLALLVVAVLGLGVASAQSTVTPAITTPSAAVWAAWQPFKGGVMMWWSDTDQIWVFFNNGPVVVYPDVYSEGTTVPPTENCEIPPIRGFGTIWYTLGGASGSLGCPMARELGYDSAARTINGTELAIAGPGETEYGVTIPAGMNVGTWRVIDIG